MPHEHSYAIDVRWTGNRGTGTSGHAAYGRDHDVAAPGKPPIQGSSDPAFRGDASRYNPEELLVASLSACHMLWYLHLCARDGVNVTRYDDHALGVMAEDANGGGRFTRVVLRPSVRLAAGADAERARLLHEDAHHLCFIANSVNFPVDCEPDFVVESGGG